MSKIPEEKNDAAFHKTISTHGGLVFKHVCDMRKSETETGETHYIGVASSTRIDRDNERITKSALEKGAKDLMKNSTVFFNHKHDAMPIGKVVNAYIQGDQLIAEWVPSQADCTKDVRTMLDEGVLKSMSVAGKLKDYSFEFDESLQKSVKVISDVELFEVSVVGVPANPDATIVGSIAKAYEFEKSRFATSVDDNPEKVKGDGGEAEEKAPIVAPKKKKTKDGEVVQDDIYDSAREHSAKKTAGDSMTLEGTTPATDVAKENRPSTPNEPALGSSGHQIDDIREFVSELEALLRKVKKEGAPVNTDPRGAPATMPEKPPEAKKSVEETDMLKKQYEELKTQMDALQKSIAKPAGLAVAEVPALLKDVKKPEPVVQRLY